MAMKALDFYNLAQKYTSSDEHLKQNAETRKKELEAFSDHFNKLFDEESADMDDEELEAYKAQFKPYEANKQYSVSQGTSHEFARRIQDAKNTESWKNLPDNEKAKYNQVIGQKYRGLRLAEGLPVESVGYDAKADAAQNTVKEWLGLEAKDQPQEVKDLSWETAAKSVAKSLGRVPGSLASTGLGAAGFGYDLLGGGLQVLPWQWAKDLGQLSKDTGAVLGTTANAIDTVNRNILPPEQKQSSSVSEWWNGRNAEQKVLGILDEAPEQFFTFILPMLTGNAAAKSAQMARDGKLGGWLGNLLNKISSSPKYSKWFKSSANGLEKGLTKANQLLSGINPEKARKAYTFLGSSAIEASEMAKNAYRNQGEIRSPLNMLSHALLAGKLESLVPEKLGNVFSPQTRALLRRDFGKGAWKSSSRFIRNLGKDTLSNLVDEGLTELAQTYVEQSADMYNRNGMTAEGIAPVHDINAAIGILKKDGINGLIKEAGKNERIADIFMATLLGGITGGVGTAMTHPVNYVRYHASPEGYLDRYRENREALLSGISNSFLNEEERNQKQQELNRLEDARKKWELANPLNFGQGGHNTIMRSLQEMGDPETGDDDLKDAIRTLSELNDDELMSYIEQLRNVGWKTNETFNKNLEKLFNYNSVLQNWNERDAIGKFLRGEQLTKEEENSVQNALNKYSGQTSDIGNALSQEIDYLNKQPDALWNRSPLNTGNNKQRVQQIQRDIGQTNHPDSRQNIQQPAQQAQQQAPQEPPASVSGDDFHAEGAQGRRYSESEEDYRTEAERLADDGTAVTREEFEDYVNVLNQTLDKNTGIRFETYDSAEEFNRTHKNKVPSNANAFYSKGKIVLIRDSIKTLTRLKQIAAHELIGHIGVKRLLGGRYYRVFLSSLLDLSRKDRGVKKLFSRVKSTYAGQIMSYSDSQDRTAYALEELGSHLTELYGRKPERFSEKVAHCFNRLRVMFRNALRNWGIYIALDQNDLREIFSRSYEMVEKSNSGKNRSPVTKYSLKGRDEDGIEIYETSSDTLNLSMKERRKKAKQMILDTYKGRTAKFTRDGETYYAKFSKDDLNKLLYGDKKSTSNGKIAKLNSIADGDVFELVENAKYVGSSKEQGKGKSIHSDTNNWDYFDKKVSIDGIYYNVLANVRKNSKGEWVYDITLRNDKNRKGAASAKARQYVNENISAVNSADTTPFDLIIPKSDKNRNPVTKYSLRSLPEDKKPVVGEKLRRKISRFIDELKGASLDGEQAGIYNVFTVKQKSYKIADLNAVGDYVLMELGKRHYGAKHIMMKHYDTDIVPITAKDIISIGKVIRNGELSMDGGGRVYVLENDDGKVLKAVVKDNGKGEPTVITFHSKRTDGSNAGHEGTSALQETASNSMIPESGQNRKADKNGRQRLEDFANELEALIKEAKEEGEHLADLEFFGGEDEELDNLDFADRHSTSNNEKPKWSLKDGADQYLSRTADSVEIDIENLRTLKDEPRKSIDRAKMYMEMASKGEKAKRKPISVVDNGDGTYTVADGNATTHGLLELGEGKAICRVVGKNTGTRLGNSAYVVENDNSGIDFSDGRLRAHNIGDSKSLEAGERLYEQARENLPMLEDIVETAARKIGATVSMRPVDKETGEAVKKRERVDEKALNDYEGDYSRVIDLIGGTIVIGDKGDFADAIKAIKKNLPEGISIARVKKYNPEVEGYQDIKVSIRFPNGGIGEVIIVSKFMKEAKTNRGGHDVYDVLRKLDVILQQKMSDSLKEQVENAREAVKKLSDAIYSRGAKVPRTEDFESIKASASSWLTRLAPRLASLFSSEDIGFVKSPSSSDHFKSPLSVNSKAMPNLSLIQYDIENAPNLSELRGEVDKKYDSKSWLSKLHAAQPLSTSVHSMAGRPFIQHGTSKPSSALSIADAGDTVNPSNSEHGENHKNNGLSKNKDLSRKHSMGEDGQRLANPKNDNLEDLYNNLMNGSEDEYRKPEDRKYALGGEKARTANVANLEEARRLLNEGTGKREVWQKTGRYIAKDGKPIRFSLSSPVERTNNLIAVHNLHEDELLESLNLGGLPMPSIAIVKDSMGHNNYGEISVVFNRDTIDPKFFRSNKVYSGDAYTPSFPRLGYKIDTDKCCKIRKRMEKELGSEVFKGLGYSNLDEDNIKSVIDRVGEKNLADEYGKKSILKALFLNDKNIAFSSEYKTYDYTKDSDLGNNFLKEVIKELGEERIIDINTTGENLTDKEVEAIRNLANSYYIKNNKEEYDRIKARFPRYERYKPEYNGWGWADAITRDAYLYQRNGDRTVLDDTKTEANINKAIEGHKEEYRQWLDNLFDGIIEKKGVRNDKDAFTGIGNRRSFESLHYEYNLENIVKAMKKEDQQGANSFGGYDLFGSSTTMYDSIKSIKQDSDRLRLISEDDYDNIRKEFKSRFRLSESRL